MICSDFLFYKPRVLSSIFVVEGVKLLVCVDFGKGEETIHLFI